MITKIAKGQRIEEITFNKNVAIVAKCKANNEGVYSTTFVEFNNLKDRNTAAVLRCVIAGILSDESINNELKEAFSTLQSENGKKAAFEVENTAFATAFVAKRKEANKALYLPPTFRRLIASFSDSYIVGFTDDKGKAVALFKVENVNLRSLLLVNTSKIEEYTAANSATRRAIVYTLAKAAEANIAKEAKYLKQYNATTAAAKEAKPEAKPEAAKGKAKKPEAKPEAAKA